ncbi:MAG: Ribonuclease Y, partial [Candidatus Giovannonibacteria bacterium GW2011_GWA2_53_7]
MDPINTISTVGFTTVVAIGVSSGIFGIILGYVVRWALTAGKKGSIELEMKQILLSGKEEAQKITEEAERRAEKAAEEVRRKEKDKEQEWRKVEDRLVKKEELLDKRQGDIDTEVSNIKSKAEELRGIKDQIEERKRDIEKELERISGLSEEEAKKGFLDKIEKRSEEDFMVRLQKLEREGLDRLDRRAKDILATSIQRLAASTAGEVMTSSITIPNDELKGKIIGKEGRNIRTFERIAGVELIVDDTPGTIVISTFDPVR